MKRIFFAIFFLTATQPAFAGTLRSIDNTVIEKNPQGHCEMGKVTLSETWWRDTQAIMGTDIRVEVMHEDKRVACSAIADVMVEMRRIDQLMSPFIPSSQLSKLNQNGFKQPVKVSKELFDVIQESIRVSEMTLGAFDITYASAGRFYDFREDIRPNDAVLARALAAIDYRYISLDPRNQTIRFSHEGVYIDLGGIAKGYAVDQGIKILVQNGIMQAMVGAGGDSRIIGTRDGEPWVIGIRNPRDAAQMVAVLPLMDVSVSTSGDYERYFEENGIRYHHILDPKTGDSVRQVQSVTIVGTNAMQTDALSTSVFVLGVNQGLALINTLSNIDAIIVDGSGQMHVSDSLLEMTASVTP